MLTGFPCSCLNCTKRSDSLQASFLELLNREKLNSGILANNASVLPGVQQGVIQQALNQLLANPAIVLCYYILFGVGVVAICSAAWTLYCAGVPRLPLIILLGTLLSTYSHALPFGPLGSACFFLAALWIELVWRSSPHHEYEVQGVAPVVEQLNVQ